MEKHYKEKLEPELRFPEFRDKGEWKVEDFKKVFTRLTNKNVEDNQNVLTISAQQGLVSQLDYFNKSIAAKDVTGYYLLHKGDFAYNKSYSKGYPMGAIKQLKNYEKGVVSTLYICFRANRGYSESFFEQYFDAGMLNNEIAKIAQEGGRNHGLLNVSVREFFRDVRLVVPSFSEQQKIANSLSSLDELITVQRRKLESLKAHKKGLLQHLFPAEGETVPKLRFPEFRDTGEWEEQEVGDIFKVTRGNVLSMSLVQDKKTEAMPYPVYSSQTKSNGLSGFYSEYLYENAITWTTDGANAGEVNYRAGKFYCTNVCGVLLSKAGYANEFVAALINSVSKKHVSYVGNPKLMNGVMSRIKIPLPSIPELLSTRQKPKTAVQVRLFGCRVGEQMPEMV